MNRRFHRPVITLIRRAVAAPRHSGPVAAMVMLSVALVSACSVTPVRRVEVKTPQALTSEADAAPVEFRKIVTRVPFGEQIAQLQYGWGCALVAKPDWLGGQLPAPDDELIDAFRRELRSQHFPVAGDSYARSTGPLAGEADLTVTALIDKLDIKACFPTSLGPKVAIGDPSEVKGGTFMRVTWQIHSRATRQVVYETVTEGSATIDRMTPGGLTLLLRQAFAANTRNLLADAGYREVVLKASRAGTASGG